MENQSLFIVIQEVEGRAVLTLMILYCRYRSRLFEDMVFGYVTIEGNDYTKNTLSMYYRSLKRDDINCIMLDGLVISMYNIIDGEELGENTNLPVIAITFKDSGLEGTIQHRFSNELKA